MIIFVTIITIFCDYNNHQFVIVWLMRVIMMIEHTNGILRWHFRWKWWCKSIEKPRTIFFLFLNFNPVKRTLCTFKGGFIYIWDGILRGHCRWKWWYGSAYFCTETNFKLRRSGPGKKIASITISRISNFSICQWLGRRSDFHNGSKFEAVFSSDQFWKLLAISGFATIRKSGSFPLANQRNWSLQPITTSKWTLSFSKTWW